MVGGHNLLIEIVQPQPAEPRLCLGRTCKPCRISKQRTWDQNGVINRKSASQKLRYRERRKP